MTVEQFESVSLYLGVGGLVLYCVFIMYKLAKESNAGKFGTFIIFLVLGLGIFAFVAKEIVVLFLDGVQ